MSASFILASGSPRRKELLSAAGFRFEVVAPEVDEIQSGDLTLREMTSANALRKGRAVAFARPHEVVVACDTLVSLDGKIIGKPADLPGARAILRALSGRTHEVCSAVFIGRGRRGLRHLFQVVSAVRFRELTDEAITAYLRKIEPLDKAGAYAAQGEGREVIAEIKGSYSNVVGLPMTETIGALRDFGIRPRAA